MNTLLRQPVLRLLFAALLLSAGLRAEENRHLNGMNAFILQPGTWRYSIFGSTTYGISNGVAVSAHPLFVFVSPSVDVQYSLWSSDFLQISGVTGFLYPTQIMRMAAAKGTGGFISPEFNIPHMIALRTGIVGTLQMSDVHYLSASSMFEFALNNEKLAPGSSIDLPVIAPALAVFYKNAGFSFALSAEGSLTSFLSYYLKSDVLLFPFKAAAYDNEYPLGQQDLFFNVSAATIWHLTGTAQISAGTKVTYGEYPFGPQWHLFPTIDFTKWIE